MTAEALKPEMLQTIANEIANTDSSLTPNDVLNSLALSLAEPSESDIFQTAAQANPLLPRVMSVLIQLALRSDAKVTERRPQVLECDVWRFQNKKEKWVAFVGLLDGRPYEIFTGLQDDDEGILLPKSVHSGWIIKNQQPDGSSRYDFSFQNSRGYKITVEGLSGKFNKEYWNYAKLISGVLRYGMPIDHVIRLIDSLQLDQTINTWTAGVVRALKKYTNAAADASATEGEEESTEA